MPTRTAALLLKFKDDTLATVSRGSVKLMAKKLGFNETQVLHYARGIVFQAGSSRIVSR